eukprot:COSAG02_NODE_53479_length_301_cov_1.272277_1_plen_56_part_01
MLELRYSPSRFSGQSRARGLTNYRIFDQKHKQFNKSLLETARNPTVIPGIHELVYN